MHLVYLVALLAALLAMNWRFIGMDKLFGGRRNDRAAPRLCAWRMDPQRSGEARQTWICADCGAEADTTNKRRPEECRRPSG